MEAREPLTLGGRPEPLRCSVESCRKECERVHVHVGGRVLCLECYTALYGWNQLNQQPDPGP